MTSSLADVYEYHMLTKCISLAQKVSCTETKIIYIIIKKIVVGKNEIIMACTTTCYRYELVLPGEICCPDNKEDRVAIGTGDSCCGTVPYLIDGSQICCNGKAKYFL